MRRFQARIDNSRYGKRHIAGQQNRTEAAYAETLWARQKCGGIISYEFECYTLKIADNTRYTPDFAVVLPDGTMEFIDVKGGCIDPKSIVKIKCAAERFPQFLFVVEQKLAVKAGGGWKRTEY